MYVCFMSFLFADAGKANATSFALNDIIIILSFLFFIILTWIDKEIMLFIIGGTIITLAISSLIQGVTTNDSNIENNNSIPTATATVDNNSNIDVTTILDTLSQLVVPIIGITLFLLLYKSYRESIYYR